MVYDGETSASFGDGFTQCRSGLSGKAHDPVDPHSTTAVGRQPNCG